MGTHGKPEGLPSQAQMPEGPQDTQAPQNSPEDIEDLSADELSLELLRRINEVSPHLLHAVHAAVQARLAAADLQSVQVALNVEAEIETEPTYFENIVDFMNPEKPMLLDEQFAVMTEFWEERGLSMANSFTADEAQELRQVTEQNPRLRLVATPLPVDPFERSKLHSIGHDVEGANADDEMELAELSRRFQPHSTQHHGDVLVSPYDSAESDLDDIFAKAYSGEKYQVKEERGRKHTAVVIDEVFLALGYATYDGAVFSRRDYLQHLHERSAGAALIDNGRWLWTYQLVDVSPLQPASVAQTPEAVVQKLKPTNTPELEITMAELANDAGVFDPNALTSAPGRVEPQRLVNEWVVGYKAEPDGTTRAVFQHNQAAVRSYDTAADAVHPRGVHFLRVGSGNEPHVSFTATSTLSKDKRRQPVKPQQAA
jgi:hypothetical protein